MGLLLVTSLIKKFTNLKWSTGTRDDGTVDPRLIAQIIEVHAFISRTPLKYSNKTHTHTQNTLIEQSFQ